MIFTPKQRRQDKVMHGAYACVHAHLHAQADIAAGDRRELIIADQGAIVVAADGLARGQPRLIRHLRCAQARAWRRGWHH